MLHISRLSDYALMIMTYLAVYPRDTFSKTQLSTALHLPPPTVAKILKLLRKSGMISSKKGLNGGYQLCISFKEITLYKIIVAIDGSVALTDCLINKSLCNFSNTCQTHSIWEQVDTRIHSILEDICMDDILTFHTLEGRKYEKHNYS